MTPTQDKKPESRALLVMAGCAVLAVMCGLFLVFAPDDAAQGRYFENRAASYGHQPPQTDDINRPGQAYYFYLKALQHTPYDADLWLRLADAASKTAQGREKALRALEIAYSLDPSLDRAIHERRLLDEGGHP